RITDLTANKTAQLYQFGSQGWRYADDLVTKDNGALAEQNNESKQYGQKPDQTTAAAALRIIVFRVALNATAILPFHLYLGRCAPLVLIIGAATRQAGRAHDK